MITLKKFVYAVSRSWLACLIVFIFICAKAYAKQSTLSYLWAPIAGITPEIIDVILGFSAAYLGVQLRANWLKRVEVSFSNVFGAGFAKGEHFFSIPTFKLNSDCRDILAAKGIHNSRQLFDLYNVDAQYTGGDLQKILASADIVGAAYLLDEFGRHTKKGPKIDFAKNFSGSSKNYIAVGMQTNPNTPYFITTLSSSSRKERLSDSGESELDDKILENIRTLKTFKSCKLVVSDDKLSTSLRVNVTDDESFDVIADPDQRWGIGLCVLIRHTDNDNKEYRHILCAGIGPVGTTGSSWYLAKKWASFEGDMTSSERYDAIVSFTYTPHIVSEEGVERGMDAVEASDSGTKELARFGIKS